jgi:AraC-like DNA-binding protein
MLTDPTTAIRPSTVTCLACKKRDKGISTIWTGVEGLALMDTKVASTNAPTKTPDRDGAPRERGDAPAAFPLRAGVSMTLSERMRGDRAAAATVAKRLGLNTRTMQRRLGELGTTYQEVHDDLRQRSARRLPANTDLGIGEVAFHLATPAKWRARATVRQGDPQRESPRA